jgi:hypothetical protein
MTTAKQRRLQNEQEILKVVESIKVVQADLTTPKNVKKLVKETIDRLNRVDLSPGIKAASAIQLLEEANQDSNLSMLSRTRIWNALTKLETIKD